MEKNNKLKNNKFENALLTFIRKLAVRDDETGAFNKEETKKNVKDELQRKIDCEHNKLSMELKEVFEDYDSNFESAYNRFLFIQHLERERRENKPKEGNKQCDKRKTFVKELQVMEMRHGVPINYVPQKNLIEFSKKSSDYGEQQCQK